MSFIIAPGSHRFKIIEKTELDKFNVGDKVFMNSTGEYQLLTDFERIVYKLKGRDITHSFIIIDKNKDFIECVTSYEY